MPGRPRWLVGSSPLLFVGGLVAACAGTNSVDPSRSELQDAGPQLPIDAGDAGKQPTPSVDAGDEGDAGPALPTSTDGKKNGTETDIDCGGPSAPKCGTNKACQVVTDCQSKICTNNLCAKKRSNRHIRADSRSRPSVAAAIDRIVPLVHAASSYDASTNPFSRQRGMR